MGLKRPTIKLNILVLRQTNENIVVFSVLKFRVVLSEVFPNCPIVSADLKITFVHCRFLCIDEKLQIGLVYVTPDCGDKEAFVTENRFRYSNV